MSKSNVYGVVLPLDIAKKARVVAAMEGKSRSRLMRDLLEKYLKSYSGSEFEIEKRYGERDDRSF